MYKEDGDKKAKKSPEDSSDEEESHRRGTTGSMEEETLPQSKSNRLVRGSLIEEEDVSMDFMYSNRTKIAEAKKPGGLDDFADKKRARARESGAMEEEGGILGFENDRAELAGYKEGKKEDEDYIEELIQEKMLKNAGMRKPIVAEDEDEDEDYVVKKKVQRKKFMISLNDPLSFNGVCKGYMTLWFAYHFKTFKIMHSEEFESVLLSLISIEDYEFFRNVGNCLSEFHIQFKKMDY